MDDEGGTVEPELCTKELRKQKLMEYLAANGRICCFFSHSKQSAKSKENQAPNAGNMRNEAQKVQPRNTKGASFLLGLSENGAQTRKYTIASIKSNLNATNKTKKQLSMGIKPPVRYSSSKSLSNIPRPTASQTQPNRDSWATRVAKSGLQMTYSSRMSLGPITKTKTGLIPAVLQPRTTIPTAATTASSTANRGHSNYATRLVSSVAKNATLVRGKPFSTTVGLKHTRITATGASDTVIKTKTLNKTVSEPPPVKSLKPSLQNRPTAFKATFTRSKTAPVKQHQNERVTKSIQSVQLSKKASEHTSGVEGTGNAQPQKFVSGGSSGAGGQRQNTVSNRTTHTAGMKGKVKVHGVVDNKSATDSTKESHQNRPPAFKATSTRLTTAPANPDQRVTKYAKSVQSSKKASEHRSGVAGTGNAQSQKGGSLRTSEAVGQRQNTASTRATHAAELTEKDKVHRVASNNKEVCTSTRRAGIPFVPQTVPRRAKSLSLVEWATDTKTPRAQATVVPQTEKNNLTAAQEERMRKLREWREAKGISYKRPPMQVRPAHVRRTVALSQPYWTNMDDDDDTRALICAVDRSLADCVKLLEEGGLPEQVLEHLSRLPAMAQKFAKYWICQARLMERQGNLEVLPMFEEAVRVVLEPVDGLRDVVFDILKKKDDIQGRACRCACTKELQKQEVSPVHGQNLSEAAVTPTFTPNPVRACIYGEKGSSSMVKYKITSTPTPNAKQREPVRVNGQEVRFITPVRRSVRIEGASLRYPASLQDHDVCVSTYNDLMVQEDGDGEAREASPSTHGTPMYVYMENEALKDKVHVQLFTNDDD